MNISFIQNQVTMYDHLPCTHPARSGIWKKIPFFGFKNIFSHVLEVAPNITAMVNLLLKSPKKSNGLKGNHMNRKKNSCTQIVHSKYTSIKTHSIKECLKLLNCVYIQTEMEQFPD